VIPVLLTTQDEAVKEIMDLIANSCSTKEIVIAVQEAVERIQNDFASGWDEDEGQESGMSLVVQLGTLIFLYSSCEFNFSSEIINSPSGCCNSYSSTEPTKQDSLRSNPPHCD
jgi:uncharacterized protein YoaH (UPF0181 family)